MVSLHSTLASAFDGVLLTPVFAGAFTTFLLFVALGIGALFFTAALDGSLGKEKALLLYAGLVLLLTMFVIGPAAAKGAKKGRAGAEDKVPASELDQQGNPFHREVLGPDVEFATENDSGDDSRNIFQKYSDTRPLAPIALATPPWLKLDFHLPPTIPGPAPGARHVLRGQRPGPSASEGEEGDDEDGESMPEGDGSLGEVPTASFTTYEPQPADVYDWVLQGSRPQYIYIRAINAGSGWVGEGAPGFRDLLWSLAKPSGSDRDRLNVRFAVIGGESEAAKRLAPEAIVKARGSSVTTARATDKPRWFLRRSVDNLYLAATRSNGITDLSGATDAGALTRAAEEMAKVGATGKEFGEGWRRAAELLEAALTIAEKSGSTAQQTAILTNLLKAYRATNDEQSELRVLAKYARTSPTASEAWSSIGDLFVTALNLPKEALPYYERAIQLDSRNARAIIGRGRALSLAGRYDDGLDVLRNTPGGNPDAEAARAMAQLRVGKLDEAKSTAERVLSSNADHAQAMLVRGAVFYAKGELEAALPVFQQVLVMPSAQAWRAMAAYNLGLTATRMNRFAMASAAFDAADKALLFGSRSALSPEETVAPSLGRAFLALAKGDEADITTQLDSARNEAPRSAYVDLFAAQYFAGQPLSQSAAAFRHLTDAFRKSKGYGEIDGWMGKVCSELGVLEGAEGGGESRAGNFERAVAFMKRIADREDKRDRDAFAMRVREAMVRINRTDLPRRRRYTEALDAVNMVLKKNQRREEPSALAVRAYCNYQLADYDQCIRDFDNILSTVPADATDWRRAFRDYAEEQRAAVNKWRSLEVKTVTFDQDQLPRDLWRPDESGRVKIRSGDGWLHFVGQSSRDGSLEKPVVAVNNPTLFDKNSFVELAVVLKIPKMDRSAAVNNVTFGIEVMRASRRGRSSSSKSMGGIGIFYDKGRVAARSAKGSEDAFKDAVIHRLLDDGAEVDWPDGNDGEVEVRFVREVDEKGTMVVYIDGKEFHRDDISTFKRSNGSAALWIGGFSTQAQKFDIRVGQIRVIRRR